MISVSSKAIKKLKQRLPEQVMRRVTVVWDKRAQRLHVEVWPFSEESVQKMKFDKHTSYEKIVDKILLLI